MCVTEVFTHCRSWTIWWSDWPDSVGLKRDWGNLRHLCRHCQTEQAPPLVLDTIDAFSQILQKTLRKKNMK